MTDPETQDRGESAPEPVPVPAGKAPEPLEAFSRLQQQVELAVSALDRLRSENQRLQKELGSAQEMLQLTQEEVDRLVVERNEVCARIQAVMTSLTQAGVGS
jgi:chromosome segregation ATPase